MHNVDNNIHINVMYMNTATRSQIHTVPGFPSCVGVLKHTVPLARGCSSSYQKKQFYDRFLLLWCNFNFEDVLFPSVSKYSDIVNSLWKCAIKQAVIPPWGTKYGASQLNQHIPSFVLNPALNTEPYKCTM